MSILRRLLPILICILSAPVLTSCITEDVPANTPRGNFESLWSTLDARYCFFPYKAQQYGLDWDEVRERYSQRIQDDLTEKQLFEVLGDMTRELRDGHVNLYASHDVARYGEWFDRYAANCYDTLITAYLGRTEDYMKTAGLSYRILSDNVGYIRCPSFENAIGDGNLHAVMQALALCDALIVDVRSNGGGQLSSAQKLASAFVNETTTGGYICHKTGSAHDAFSAPEVITIEPFEGLRWQKPVAVLTNRRTYSAANSFVMYMKGLDNVTIVGDVTGGGSGLPLVSELPNGWTVRFSACPMFDRAMNHTEFGVNPDVRVDISAEDFSRSVDTIIETARTLLREKGAKSGGEGE